MIYSDPSNSSYDKGIIFENLVSKVFKNQRYSVKERINFTGMEIDLLCNHLDRNETAFVECKAREELSANDIENFVFKVQFKRFTNGFFLYTKYFQHQAGGIIEELKKDERYKDIYFWDCEKIIDLLVDSKEIHEFSLNIENFKIFKTILLYSYLGVYYIALLSNSTIPEYFTICRADNLEPVKDKNTIDSIQKIVKDIQNKSFIENQSTLVVKKNHETKVNIDIVAEIQESESWNDLKPASTKYFVGRKIIKDQIFDLFEKMLKNQTKNRIFYIEGKSGWGKSSLLTELRGRCRNKHYKNKYFLFPVDSRSADSSNFVALTFKKLLEEAVSEGFLDFELNKLEIISNYDILSSDSVKQAIEYLSANSKLIILVFDQFEDVFRKGDLFQAFHKFLLDIKNLCSNIAVGFSWKSEINISIAHEAYYLWQQAKDYSLKFNMPEFDFSERKQIINQLEKAINNKLDVEFVRKIADNSQGFPWLVKKLCVHIFNQIQNNISINTLYDQDLNVESLFKEDLEGLSPDEKKALVYIAKRAYEDNAFDTTEIDEIIPAIIMDSLVLHKKLVIKSGSKYNIYWDIFRDYLVTNEIPKIGESYLLRQTVQPVLDMYLLFRKDNSMTLEDIDRIISNPIKKGTILNSLRILRDIGLIKYVNDTYCLKKPEIEVNEIEFRNYVEEKLQKHTLFLELQKLDSEEIDLYEIADIIKTKFNGRDFSDRTLEVYAKNFINWIKFAGIDLPQVSTRLKNELDDLISFIPRNLTSFTPQNKPEEDVEFFKSISNEQFYEQDRKTLKILYDLKALGLLVYMNNKIYLTEKGKNIHENDLEFNKTICLEALKTERISRAYTVYCNNPNIKIKIFKEGIADILEGINSKVYLNKTSRVLLDWSKFIYQILNKV